MSDYFGSDALARAGAKLSMHEDSPKVAGRPVYEVFDSKKNDLDAMLACCRAIEKNCSKYDFKKQPPPAYFERVAILMSKKKDIEGEIGILERWVALEDAYQQESGASGCSGGSRLELRLAKANKKRGH